MNNNERELIRLQQRVAKLEQLIEQLTQPKSVGRLIIPEAIQLCKNGGSTIAARSGSTLSKRSCTKYTAPGGSLTAGSASIDVYNLSTVAVAANAYIIALFAGGIWLCGWEDC